MKKLKVYLDNCCFNRPYDKQANISIRLETEAKLYIQSEIKANNLLLYWSYMLSYENSRNSDLFKRNTIELWKDMSFYIIQPDKSIDIEADRLNKLGFKEADSLHIACSIIAMCDYFLTTDKGILNKGKLIEEINIVNPLEFIENIYGGYYDD